MISDRLVPDRCGLVRFKGDGPPLDYVGNGITLIARRPGRYRG